MSLSREISPFLASMRLHFVLIAGLVLLLAEPSLAQEAEGDDSGDTGEAGDDISDDMVGLFYFGGSNEGYAELGEQSDSDSSVIEEWNNRDYGSSSRMISLGTWLKPEKNTSGLNKIMQFKLVHHYELSMEGGQLKLLVVEQSDSYKVFSFPSLNVSMNEWHLVLITVYPRGSSPPSVYTKGLDKAPLKLLDSQISEQGELENENTRSNHLTLGQGFTGRIAPVLIGRHYSSSYFNRYKDCLTSRDQSSSECTGRMNSVMPGSNLVSSYKLSPNSNIKLEPYTDINVSFDTDIQCKDFEVSLNIIPTAFNLPTPTRKSVRYYDRSYYYGQYRTRTYVDYPVNVTLGELESGCNLTWASSEEGGYEITDTNLTSCGFESRGDGEEVIYMNSVYSHTHTESRKLMDVSCRYAPRPVKREEVRVSAYVVDEISLETTHTFTPWSLSLHLYSDSSYSRELDVPVKLGNTGERIYAEAKVETSVEGVTLEIESCRTHITLDELDEMQKTLIRNYKTVSPSVEFLNTDDTTRKRFMFKADKFEEYPKAMVYLSCVLTAKQGEAAPPTTEKVVKKTTRATTPGPSTRSTTSEDYSSSTSIVY